MLGGRSFALPLSALVALVVHPACSPDWPEAPNVVLISVDSLRADHLGAYGYERDTSPNLDRLAADGVVFDAAYSTTSWTLPSHLSMLTGLYPEVHGIQRGKRRLSEDFVLLPEVLQGAGYTTAALVVAPYLNRRFGINQGWDDYDDYTFRYRSTPSAHHGVKAPREHERLLELVDQIASQSFFLFLHYWDVHYDYTPPPPWDRAFDPTYDGDLDGRDFFDNPEVHAGMDRRDLEWIESLYDGEIAFTDHYLGLFLDDLERRGLYDDTLIIFTADHGDEFFDHGNKGHRANLYNETLRVPLVIKFPGGRWSGTRSAEPVGLVDLFPTILDVTAVESPVRSNGRSLASRPSRSAGQDSRPLFADLHGVRKAVILDGWKLIVSPEETEPSPELYDLREDPEEKRDLYDREPQRAAELRRALDRWLLLASEWEAAAPTEVEYDAETVELLESLGYVD